MPDDAKPDLRAQELAERAAFRSITDTFRLLGIDITEMGDVNDLRDDFRFIRRQRENNEIRRTEASKSAVTAVIGGVVGMLISAVTWLLTIARHPQ
ncbi:hypothetical protein [Acidisphaera sp. L21]|uniref:hypothetical protein n=1 Tax=Acidisphaera sp. L21 TaxID=1641851 RepID=UPI00131EC816|nr:hypothetical protein [Acidisphaera sp. L21]